MIRGSAFAGSFSRLLRLLGPCAAILILTSCGTPPAPSGDGRIDLEGLWLVTTNGGSNYAGEGTTTLEFGSAPSGGAQYLNRSAVNGITFCETHAYTALSDKVVLLDGDHYEVTTAAAGELELAFGMALLNLTRVTGAPPVEPCLEADAVEVGKLSEEPGSWTSLSAFGDQLYLNTDQTGNLIVGFDIGTGLFGMGREYTGNHDHVVAVRSDSEFYAHCACGNITTLERFDVDSDTMLAAANSQVDYGHFMALETGTFSGSSLIVTGRDYEDSGVNRVLTVDPNTLALQSEREVLPEASIEDLAWNGTQLVALVNGLIVTIGADGMAEETIRLEGAVNDFPDGLTFAEGAYYLLYQDAEDNAVIYRAQVP